MLWAKKVKGAGGKGGNMPAAPPRERKVKEGVIEVDGVVKEALPSTKFMVELSGLDQVRSLLHQPLLSPAVLSDLRVRC